MGLDRTNSEGTGNPAPSGCIWEKTHWQKCIAIKRQLDQFSTRPTCGWEDNSLWKLCSSAAPGAACPVSAVSGRYVNRSIVWQSQVHYRLHINQESTGRARRCPDLAFLACSSQHSSNSRTDRVFTRLLSDTTPAAVGPFVMFPIKLKKAVDRLQHRVREFPQVMIVMLMIMQDKEKRWRQSDRLRELFPSLVTSVWLKW